LLVGAGDPGLRPDPLGSIKQKTPNPTSFEKSNWALWPLKNCPWALWPLDVHIFSKKWAEMSSLLANVAISPALGAPLLNDDFSFNFYPFPEHFATYRAGNGVPFKTQINPFCFASHSGMVMVIAGVGIRL